MVKEQFATTKQGKEMRGTGGTLLGGCKDYSMERSHKKAAVETTITTACPHFNSIRLQYDREAAFPCVSSLEQRLGRRGGQQLDNVVWGFSGRYAN